MDAKARRRRRQGCRERRHRTAVTGRGSGGCGREDAESKCGAEKEVPILGDAAKNVAGRIKVNGGEKWI
jgi:hypothetical protein